MGGCQVRDKEPRPGPSSNWEESRHDTDQVGMLGGEWLCLKMGFESLEELGQAGIRDKCKGLEATWEECRGQPPALYTPWGSFPARL